ncbi:NmrA family transcriptional regulator [Actinoallomurus sp. CA-150999]|uniref:NmrA family transcriptional regulator n=1 Tax=Actinoallomurus sp. CA-150999 TaxID=3239887 RepID=UPI003D90F1D9
MTQITRDGETILVLGGTGKTGRRVAERLKARGLPVRVGSRSGSPPFDWTDPGTWEPALDGAAAAYLSYQPDLAVPGAVDAIRGLTETALAGGTRRLVLLSGRGEEEAQACEKVLADAGAEWTVLRCAWFAQNFSEGELTDPVREGEVVLPADDVGEPFVDVDDIADVAVAALTEDGHTGQIYELTGPRLLTFADAVTEIAKATGRDISYLSVAPDAFAAGLRAQGVPAEVVDLLTYLFTTLFDGRNAHLGDGVQRALGRPPADFRDFARRTAATGIWNGAER